MDWAKWVGNTDQYISIFSQAIFILSLMRYSCMRCLFNLSGDIYMISHAILLFTFMRYLYYLSCNIYIFSKFNCHIKALLSVFKAIITPRIEYGLNLFGFTNTTLLQKLKTIINTGLRLIFGAFRTTPTHNRKQNQMHHNQTNKKRKFYNH